MSDSKLITGSEVLKTVLSDYREGRAPELWRTQDSGWDAFECGTGLITIVAAPPKAGKTALVMQQVSDMLLHNKELKAYIANCEVSPEAMMQRLLSRFSNIPVSDIRFARKLKSDEMRIGKAVSQLNLFADRMIFHRGRFALDAIQNEFAAYGAGCGLFVVDYLQRLRLNSKESASDRRIELEDTMNALRDMADSGLSIVGVSAVARQKGRGGSDYAGIGLASLRGSSELEYGADSIWLLHSGKDAAENKPDTDNTKPPPSNLVVLECAANRHGDTAQIPLAFDKQRMTFHIIERKNS